MVLLSIINDKVQKVCVNMGQPRLSPEDIPVNLTGEKVINEPVTIKGHELLMTCVSMGNPHAVFFNDELKNIEYRIGDVLEDKRLLASPLIMLDTNHDGVFENKFYEFLKQNSYKGLLFLDDIHLNQPMGEFWNAITEAKEDITDLGHWSGSGIVDFSF